MNNRSHSMGITLRAVEPAVPLKASAPAAQAGQDAKPATKNIMRPPAQRVQSAKPIMPETYDMPEADVKPSKPEAYIKPDENVKSGKCAHEKPEMPEAAAYGMPNAPQIVLPSWKDDEKASPYMAAAPAARASAPIESGPAVRQSPAKDVPGAVHVRPLGMPIGAREELPDSLRNALYLPGFLREHIGKPVRVEFRFDDDAKRTGTLVEVGATYIVLRPARSAELLVCDLGSVRLISLPDNDVMA